MITCFQPAWSARALWRTQLRPDPRTILISNELLTRTAVSRLANNVIAHARTLLVLSTIGAAGRREARTIPIWPTKHQVKTSEEYDR